MSAYRVSRRKEEAMRTLVISKQGPVAPPPEMMPVLLQAFKDWRNRWRPKMENFEFFSVGGGGWGVFNTADEKELAQAMMEFPFAPFSQNEALPTVNGDEVLDMLVETVNRMIASMKPS
jgi:hypothetical protein